MTVRFVARIAIALATLLSSAWLCWGQQPMPAAGGGPSAFAPRPSEARQPSRTPPVELTGTWVSDEGEEAMAPVQPPEQIGGEPFAIDESMATGGADCEACGGEGCDNCDGGYCDPNAGAGGHGCGLFAPLWCSDMWNEVHAHRRIYAQVDYIGLWTKGNPLPPLVTTSPLGTPQAQAGRLPESATTQILFGNGNYDDEFRNGGRLTLGYWLIDGEFLGVEGQYWALNTASTTFNANSDFSSGDPNAIILARPFVNYDPSLVEPTNDAAIVAFPDGFQIGQGSTGTLDGSIDVRTTSNVQSAGALLRKLVWIDFTMQRRLDLLLGYRFFRVDDSVTINDSSTYIPTTGVIPEVTLTSQDQFSSRNFFNGGEIGMKYQSQHGRLGLEAIAKCAFGNNEQVTYINGYTTQTSGGSPVDYVGGLLAQPSNIGTHTRNVFAILPSADVSLRWDITCNWRATAGYTFVYINRVQRSGDAISLDLNPTQIRGGTLIGEPFPEFASTDSTWYAHGVTAGLEYRW